VREVVDREAVVGAGDPFRDRWYITDYQRRVVHQPAGSAMATREEGGEEGREEGREEERKKDASKGGKKD
jgi:hypothetical protein